MTFHCFIGEQGSMTDYGPAGEAALLDMALEPADSPGTIGTATLHLLAPIAAGYDIVDKMEVWIYEETAGTVTWVWFGGFVSKRSTTRIIGTLYKEWEIVCQDYNLLLDTLVGLAADVQSINLSGGVDFDNQVTALWTAMTSGAAQAVDFVSGVANLINTAVMGAQSFKGLTMRAMMQALCNEAQRIDPDLRPRFSMKMSTDLQPYLNVYDGALPLSPVYHYTDDAADIASGDPYRAIKPPFKRDLDGLRLANRRQLVRKDIGTVFTADDATSQLLYPNPYSVDGYWWDPPIVSDVTTNAAAQAAIEQAVAATAYPREVIEFAVFERVAAGDVVTLTWSPDNIIAEDKRVVGVNIMFPKKTSSYTETTLTLGARRLEYYEDGDGGIDAAPTEGVSPIPNAPTSVTATAANGVYDATRGQVYQPVGWVASTSTDVLGYWIYALQGTTYLPRVWVEGGISTAGNIYIYPGLAYEIWVKAVDGDGNESASSNIATGTAIDYPAGYWLWNPGFEEIDYTLTTKARYWTTTIVGAGGTALLNTTNVHEGLRSYKVSTTTAGNSTAVRSHKMIVTSSASYLVELWARASSAVSCLNVKVYWYKKDGTASATPSTTLVTGGALTTSFARSKWAVTAPSDATMGEVDLLNTSASTNVDMYVDSVRFVAQHPTEGIEDEAITNAKVATITDPLKLPLDLATDPLTFMYGATGVGRISYDDTGNGTLQIQAPSANEKLRLDAGSAQTVVTLGGATTEDSLTVDTGASLTGNLANWKLNGVSKASINKNGDITVASINAGAYTGLPAATTSVAGIVELATDGEAAANVVVQGNDWRLDAIKPVKLMCRAATTGNITLSGTQTVDGVALIAGDKCLVRAQSTGANNGPYVVAAGAWTRTTDADTSAKMMSGILVMVTEGTVNGDKLFGLTTNNPITLGTTALTFTQLTRNHTTMTAGTYDRLTVDAQGQVTAGFTNRGGTLPGSPTTGDEFFYTGAGKNVWVYYDGTRWLGPEHAIVWSDRYGTFQPYSIDGDILYEYRIRTGKTLWAKAWALSTHVATTNSGSHFWTVALLKASDASDITTKTTAADSANTWVAQTEVTSFTGNPFTPASVAGFAIQIRKTGSPGNIYLDFELVCHEVFI